MTQYYVIVQFSDGGIQVIPNTWLNKDAKTARWPNFTSTARYDQAVKEFELWEETWAEHPIQRILGTAQYDKARKKLRDAETLSDINSGSDRDTILRKTRKNRARKRVSSDEESNLSDDTSHNKLPPFPKLSSKGETLRSQTQELQKGPAKKRIQHHPKKVSANGTDTNEQRRSHNASKYEGSQARNNMPQNTILLLATDGNRPNDDDPYKMAEDG